MGQDDSCGICGKHYQSCKHYIKEHITEDGLISYCGKRRVLFIDNELRENTDPDDLCINCVNIEKRRNIINAKANSNRS